MGSSFLGTIGWAVSATVSLIVAFVLTRAYLRTGEKTLKYFAGFIWSRFGFFACLAITYPLYLLLKNGVLSGVILTAVWIFIWVSLLWVPFLYCSFQFPKLKDWFLRVLLLVALVGTIILVFNFAPAIYEPTAGVVFQPTPPIISTVLYPFPKILALSSLMFLFLGEATQAVGRLRRRSLLLGLGFLAIMSTVVVPAYLSPVWGGVYCSLGDILIFAGVMTKPGKTE